ncbi:zona pellucida sperm-binding protein 3 [Amia ocellicauda]|uniref:zona pellucida sperm-binding protein 3 n=1 Tax=Amia ocellicauda TaxID=2972642 RepID=UPI0034640BB4
MVAFSAVCCGLLVLFVFVALGNARRGRQHWKAPPAQPLATKVALWDSGPSSQNLSQVVSALCGETNIQVSVKRDLFGTGQLIQASDVQLGGCLVDTEDDLAQILFFQSELQGCGSVLSTVGDKLVYSFLLQYNPSPLPNTPIVRTNPAVVSVQCSYMRLHNVSSDALKPTWVPFTSTRSAEDLLDFSLQLMTDDWSSQRPSNVYFLGDVLNIQASVNQANHVPLRLFVDSCVATLQPDQTSSPSYTFIGNHGCLTDAKVTGSSSQLMPRPLDSTKLQMQLDAFRFNQDSRSSIYITCLLKVTAASQNVDSMNKACSFNTGANRWQSVDGSDPVCACCDSSCGSALRSRYSGRAGDRTPSADWEGVLGPLTIRGRSKPLHSASRHPRPSLKLPGKAPRTYWGAAGRKSRIFP